MKELSELTLLERLGIEEVDLDIKPEPFPEEMLSRFRQIEDSNASAQ